jgi:hypothetical protein
VWPVYGVIFAGTLAPVAWAQTGAPALPPADARDADTQEYLRRQERARLLRQQQEAQPDVRLQAPAGSGRRPELRFRQRVPRSIPGRFRTRLRRHRLFILFMEKLMM